MSDQHPTLAGSSPFLRHLVGNLRISFIVIVVAAGLILVYALLTKSEVDWMIEAFIAIGMLLSSLLNAAYDARQERSEP